MDIEKLYSILLSDKPSDELLANEADLLTQNKKYHYLLNDYNYQV